MAGHLNPCAPRGRVLVVDDEPYLRAFIGDVLGSDFEVVSAGDGLEALERLVDPMDVVVVDHVMPRLSGAELIRRLRASPLHRSTPVLMITAIDDEPTLGECRRAGADRVLGKPFHPDDLLRTVRELHRAER